MATTIRRIQKFVQKIAKKAKMDAAETRLAEDCVTGISIKGSCNVSDIARTLDEKGDLRQIVRRLYDGLAAPDSNIDGMQSAWLQIVARAADRMPFFAVDTSDIIKLHGKSFDFLDIVRDASDRDKRIGPGFPLVKIDATDAQHRNLPLLCNLYSTRHPDYRDKHDTIGWAIAEVLLYCGQNALWLFDRGCDAGDFYTIIEGLGIRWVVRQLQSRNVIIPNGRKILMRDLAGSLRKPHEVSVPYVCKNTHRVKHWPLNFGYAPVRLPGRNGRFWMIVITGLRKEDMVLLTNEEIRSVKQAERIVLAFMRRWGIEEGIRCWKQKTCVEDFRVRNWDSMRRLVFFSTLACGIQAMWLLTRPATAKKLIARAKVFIKHVLFVHYRLWDGVNDALLKGA